MTTVFGIGKITSSCDVETVESQQVDRISDLPECVTSYILSRLPTKDALRTCVLSRDWKNKWTSIYNIDIDDECHIERKNEDECKLLVKDRVVSFRSYVNKVVDSTRIRSFRLVLGDISHHDPRLLGELMSKVLCQGVDNLSIVTRRSRGKISLPSSLGRHTLLTELKLSLNCTLKIHSVNCYPKLKSLNLSGSNLSGSNGIFRMANRQSNGKGHLSLTFPVLENLELCSFEFQSAKSVEINVPELVSFRAIASYKDSIIKILAPKLIKFAVSELEIYDLCAPSLRYARLCGDASRATAFLKGFPCLTSLDIPDSMAKAILQWKGVNTLTCLERLQELSVGHRYFTMEEAFSITPDEIVDLLQLTPNLQSLTLRDVLDGTLQQPLPWKRVKTLTCLERLQKLSVDGLSTKEILDLLQLTPNLQSLTLRDVLDGTIQQPLRWKGDNTLPCLERLQDLYVEGSSSKEILVLLELMPNLQYLNLYEIHHGTLQQPFPPCVLSHLKDLTIFNFSGDSDQISLANLFVEKATNLESVRVYLGKGPVMTDEKIDCWLATQGSESLIQLIII